MIKLPHQSISFFENHYSEIFESGNLAEGKWISEVATWATKYTGHPTLMQLILMGQEYFLF